MNEILPIVEKIVSLVLGQIATKENFEKYGDKLFDLIEDVVEDSETKIDDITVLPVVKALRSAMSIADLPDA